MSPLRLMFVTSSLDRGGAERFLARLAGRLVARGHVALVASLGRTAPLSAELQHLGVEVAELGGAVSAPRLIERTRRFRADVVQGWMYRGNLGACLAAATSPARPALIWSIRQGLDDYAASPAGTRWTIRGNAFASSRPRAIVYNASAAARQHEAFGFSAERTTIIPNGIDATAPTTRREDVRRALGLGSSELAIGFFARWHPVKNHEGFARAAGALCRTRADVRFVLAGAGVEPGNARLSDWLRSAGVRERCLLLGDRPDAEELVRALDVATIASHAEALPNALLEAMAAGVPCVAPDVGDVAVLLGDTGVVVARDDAEALAAGWERMLALSPAARSELGERARRRVIERYGLDRAADAFETLYARS